MYCILYTALHYIVFLFNSLLRMHTKTQLCVHCFVKHQDFSMIYLLIFTVVARVLSLLLCGRNIFLRYKVQLKFNKDMLKLSKFKIVEAYSNCLYIVCLSEVSMVCRCWKALARICFCFVYIYKLRDAYSYVTVLSQIDSDL